MTVLTQFSYTSFMNCLTASSACGDVGFVATELLLDATRANGEAEVGDDADPDPDIDEASPANGFTDVLVEDEPDQLAVPAAAWGGG